MTDTATEQSVPAFTRTQIPDMTQRQWHVELTHGEGWGCAQLASVNERSNLRLPADDGDGTVPFTGWRVTLDRDGLRSLITAAQEILAALPEK